MRHLLLPFLILIGLTASAQVRITNVRASLNTEGILVMQYDVQGIATDDSVYVAVNGLKSGRLSPITITGDMGRRVTAGVGKTIYWDIVKDAYKINEQLVVTVLVKLARGRLPQSAPTVGAAGRTRIQEPIAQTDPEQIRATPNPPLLTNKPIADPNISPVKQVETKNLDVEPASKKDQPNKVAAVPAKPVVPKPAPAPVSVERKGGGPANALLSALAPGVGNIFVQPGHKIGARPVVTLAYVGLLFYGISQHSQSQKYYTEYKALPSSTEQTNADAAYAKANNANHTAILCVGGAVAIWAVDVTATLLRGLKNQRMGNSSSQITPPRTQFSVATIGTAPVLTFKHTF